MAEPIKEKVARVINTVKEETPEILKENKGTIIGAVAGYFLAGFAERHPELITTVLGGLTGKAVDEEVKRRK